MKKMYDHRTTFWLAAFIASSFCIFLSPAVGQTCISLDDEQLLAKVDPKCKSLLQDQGLPLFLSEGQTLEGIAAQVRTYTASLGVWVPVGCRDAGLRMACHYFYLACNETTQTSIFPCIDLCHNMTNECVEYLESVGKANMLPPCIFPETNCALGSDAKVPYTQLDCPYPTEFHGSLEEAIHTQYPAQLCSLPCPGPVYTDEQWDALFLIMDIFSTISFLLGAFFVFTAFFNPITRQFPANLLPILAATSIPPTLGLMFGMFAGGARELLCSEDGEYLGMEVGGGESVGCILQGAMITFGGLAASFWWFIVGLNFVLLLVVQVKKDKLAKLEPWYHLFGWGAAVVLTIIPMAAKKIGASPTIGWCFIYDPDTDWWMYGCFYIWFIAAWLFGSFLMIGVLVALAFRTFEFSWRKDLQYFVRVLLLLCLYWLLGAFQIAYRIYGSVIKEDVQDAIENQIRCSAFTGTECELEETPSFGFLVVVTLNLACVGTTAFLALGFTKPTFTFWRSLVVGLIRAEGMSGKLLVLKAHHNKREYERARSMHKTQEESKFRSTRAMNSDTSTSVVHASPESQSMSDMESEDSSSSASSASSSSSEE
ncbi:G-protein coupled receptor Fz Smo [Balamuthia mandrillaris]